MNIYVLRGGDALLDLQKNQAEANAQLAQEHGK